MQKTHKLEQENQEKSLSPRYRCNFETRNPICSPLLYNSEDSVAKRQPLKVAQNIQNSDILIEQKNEEEEGFN